MEKVHQQSSSGERQSLYLIMRVFDLEKRSIGLRIYDDPIAAKERGDLKFEVNDWIVTPR